MITGALLCARATAGLEPLGAFNQPVFRSYGQMRAALLNELGREFADYFARPEPDAAGGTISWFAHAQGQPRRWVDLSADEQARLDPARQRIQEGLARYRAQLEQAPDNTPRSNFAKLLAQAAFVPGLEYLYVLGDQPVAAFWGFKSVTAPMGVDPLRFATGATVLRAVPPAAVAASRPWWHSRWWWLLLLLLLLLALLGLWAWWSSPPWLAATGLPFAVPVERRTSEPVPVGRTDLTGPVAVTRDGVVVPGGTVVPGGAAVSDHGVGSDDHVTGTVPGGDAAAGKPDALGAGPKPGPDAAGKDAAGKDAAGKDAAGKDAAGKDAAGKDAAGKDAAGKDAAGKDAAGKNAAALPPLPPAGQAAAHGPKLAVPPDAAPGPAGFMEGVWRSRGGLMLNGKPADEYYRFDKGGQGDVTLRTRDGSVQCTGPAQASVGAGRQLTFHEAPQLDCSDGSTVTGAVTECAPGAEGAACRGTNSADGSHFGVQIEGVQKN